MNIHSGYGSPDLIGGADNDSFTLHAGKGTQTMDGGAGTDCLRLFGSRSAYRLEQGADGSTTLLVGAERISLKNIEQVQFGDEILSLDQALKPQQGTAADDVVQLFGHQRSFDGGAGADTVYIDAYLQYGAIAFEHDATTGRWTVQTDKQSVDLQGVEFLQFNDLRIDLRENGAALLGPTRLRSDDRDNDLLSNDFAHSLYGGKGNDRLDGRGGDDILGGGLGEDTAVYRGDLSEYVVELDLRTGQAWVRDTVAGRDGKDELGNIEMLQFGDRLVRLEDVAKTFTSPEPVLPFVEDVGFIDMPGVWFGVGFATADFEPVVLTGLSLVEVGLELLPSA